VVELPKISFLIATDDHPPDIDRFLHALMSQTLAPTDYEVVIVDASGTDDYGPGYELALKRKDARLRCHFERIAAGGRAKAYNRGLEICRAPLILFFGGDGIAGPRTAEAHLRFHESHPDRHRVDDPPGEAPHAFLELAGAERRAVRGSVRRRHDLRAGAFFLRRQLLGQARLPG
jgi:glycosyltransferase involved in cell wall biosynthesis